MAMPLNSRKLLDFAYTFRDRISKEGWVPRYDLETDEFSFTIPKLSADARVKYIDNEIAFYVTPSQNIEGVFIEYFRNNFIQHHKKLAPALESVDERKLSDDDVEEDSIIELTSKQAKSVISELEEIMKYSLAEKMDHSVME